MLALIQNGCIIVPVTETNKFIQEKFIKISEGEYLININENDHVTISNLKTNAKNKLYDKLRVKNHPGLVLFSSGSTGENKASVHNICFLLEKYKVRKKTLKTITFLMYDHIGGINTLFYILSNGGLIVTIKERSPDFVLKAIEKYKVELLPTSPTFLNLLLISEAYKRYNLSSLKVISYGTEPMPINTLNKINIIFPQVSLKQTYGLSEVGILSSKSKNSNSLWLKVGGEGFKIRIVNEMLEIKAKSAMLGYLNAPNPFTKDGWFKTGDAVEVDGEYIKILGRKSEIINVGGEKVYPQEIENILLELDEIAEATVYAEKNTILGNIVCTKIRLVDKEKNQSLIIKKVKVHCTNSLERYKIPLKIKIIEKNQFNIRYKKDRLFNSKSTI
jgi:acyl-CoA synthetase (AMP-forming)/AMP-acid ligase II